MEDEPRLGSPSKDVKLLTLAELADEMCPVYISMGVSWKEYWYGDPTQLEAYHKAYEMQRERANSDAWLQGGYFYDALCAASPLLHAFAKRGTTAHPYLKAPYSMCQQGGDGQVISASEEGAAKFHAFVAQFNKKFQKK